MNTDWRFPVLKAKITDLEKKHDIYCTGVMAKGLLIYTQVNMKIKYINSCTYVF